MNQNLELEKGAVDLAHYFAAYEAEVHEEFVRLLTRVGWFPPDTIDASELFTFGVENTHHVRRCGA